MGLHDRQAEGAGRADGDFAAKRRALSAELEALRDACGRPSLRVIADHSNKVVSHSTVGKILTGDTLPRQEQLLAVVRVLLSFDHDGRLIDEPVGLKDSKLAYWRECWQTLAHLHRQRATTPSAPADGPAPQLPEPVQQPPTPPAPPAGPTALAAPARPYKPLTEVTGRNGAVVGMSFSPDGRLLAIDGYDGSQSPRVAAGEPDGDALTDTSGVVAAAFSPDGRLLATGGYGMTVQLWDAVTRRPVGDPLTGLTHTVKAVAFSPDGRLLAAADVRGKVRLWRVATRRPVGEAFTGDTSGVEVAFSPDGRLLATASSTGEVRLWKATTRQPVGDPFIVFPSGVHAVAFSPDGRLLATGDSDGKVCLWDVATRKPAGEPFTDNGYVGAVAFSPDGRLLATAATYKGTVQVWDVSTRRPVGEPLTHSDSVYAVVFSRDGRLLATGGSNGKVRLWEASDELDAVNNTRDQYN